METVKPWYQSKTVLLNLASIALGTAEQVTGTGIFGAHGDTALQVVGGLGMVLRFFTVGPVKF